ncbi:MAG: hypothetical protein ACHRXM_13750 [Isosphaerales bacterium]
MDRHPHGRGREKTSFARSFSPVLVLGALTVSGCMTTGEYAREPWAGPPERSGAGATTSVPPGASISEPVPVVRLQSPADELADGTALPQQLPQPPLPDPGLPSTAPDPAQTIPAPPSVDPTANPPPVDATAFPPAAGAAVDRNAPSLRGLSSIARNRRANRGVSAPPSDSGGPQAGVAAGPFTSGSANTQGGRLSSILRNRIQGEVGAGEEPQYNYPDIFDDPAKRYHDRFGIDEEHDRFLFPWLMNSIFEDRWLLSESDPTRAVQDQFRRRMKIDIRDPDPDTANFPNGAYTLPKGRLYIENSPVGFYGASKNTPRIYQWEYLIRYGLTDNLEFRIFSNGLTAQAPRGKQSATTGYSPLAFDFKANFWEENTRYHIPAMGAEIYLQTTFGSPAFDAGTQPSMNLLFDQTLPFEINFEYNFGIAGVQNGLGVTKYQFSYQWSFQREVVKDFDIFVQGFYNESSLPRLIQFRHLRNLQNLAAEATIPTVTVVGVGAIKTVNNRFAIFGSYNFGVTPASPRTIALLGFAVAF